MLLVHTLAGLADLKRFIVLDLCTFLGYEIRIVSSKETQHTKARTYIVRYRTYIGEVYVCARVCVYYIYYIYIYITLCSKKHL